MMSTLSSLFPFIRANTKAGTDGTAARRLRSAIVLIGGYSLVIVGLWGIFGISNGFNGETGLVYPSDIAQGFDGFFYDDPLRKFASRSSITCPTSWVRRMKSAAASCRISSSTARSGSSALF